MPVEDSVGDAWQLRLDEVSGKENIVVLPGIPAWLVSTSKLSHTHLCNFCQFKTLLSSPRHRTTGARMLHQNNAQDLHLGACISLHKCDLL